MGTSNQYGTVASIRLGWAFDLTSGQTIDFDLRFGRDNDMSSANDILDLLLDGDLLLRDMGYFCLDYFERISSAGTFCITRIPAGTTSTLLDAGRSKLIGVLRSAKRDKIKELELDAEVGTDGGVWGCLIAVQIGAEKAAEACRKLRQRRRAHGRQPTLVELDQCDWALTSRPTGPPRQISPIFTGPAGLWRLSLRGSRVARASISGANTWPTATRSNVWRSAT